MADSLDITLTSSLHWHPHQRAWIQLYYKLLMQTIRQYPSYPVCISDTAAFVGFSTFFEGSDSTGIIDREPAFGTRKAMFIRYRNAALPNLLSNFVEEYKNGRIESDSRVSSPQVQVIPPMLKEYIRISGQYGLDNDDPEPWETQTDLWNFLSATLAAMFDHGGFLDSQDTVVQSFVRVTEDSVAPDQADTRMARPFIPSTDRGSEEPQQDHPEVPTPTAKPSGKNAKKNAKKRANRRSNTWLPAERHVLWRCINTLCQQHGIDAFDHENMELQTWNSFAQDINTECEPKGQVKPRTGDNVRSQVKDAVRRKRPPISELAKRAKDMREEIAKDKNKVFPQNVRYPDEVIEISESEPENDAEAEDEE
ncbi:hypothetical protein J4E80_010134 [Alternaria sp. BMP 0032]|nr:hypothetical protein J4E80_010134 [Alternaria sp. BMP 0032]